MNEWLLVVHGVHISKQQFCRMRNAIFYLRRLFTQFVITVPHANFVQDQCYGYIDCVQRIVTYL